ncbi:MAG: histidinol-phosphatase [Magnetospiraceae bacterium]
MPSSQVPVSPDLIALAHRLADAARPIARQYFRKGVDVLDKSDASPVTQADREIEAAMRDVITAARPQDGIFGEEHGSERLDAEYVWVLDPIDGTKAFITGKPLFGTLIGLTQNRRPVLGIIDQPISEERWVGADGHGTTLNNIPVRTRSASLEEAYLYATGPDMFSEDAGTAAPFKRLSGSAKQALYGADCYAYGLLAAGYVDLVCEALLKPYDYCAVVPVVQNAGGVVTDWNGAAVTLDTGDKILAAGAPDLHAAALSRLRAP